MARDTEFESLQNRYRIAKARIKDLEEQLKDKERAWKDVKSKNKITEDLSRDLCTAILGKDKSEMKLGGEYTWDNVPIHELLRKAKDSYEEYCKIKTQSLVYWQDKSDSHSTAVERMQKALREAMMTGGLSEDDAEKYVVEVMNGKDIGNVVNNLPLDLKNAAVSGDVTIAFAQDDVMSAEELNLYSECNAIKNKPVMAGTATIIESEKRVEQKKKEKKKNTDLYVRNKDIIRQKLNDVDWAIISIMGSRGYSKYKEIEAAGNELYGGIRNSAFRTAIKNLQSYELVDSETINTPIAKSLNLHKLSDLGKEFYEEQYHEEPVMAEMDRIKAEHDNYQHGYGIMEAAEILEESGVYKTVTTFNREHPIKLKGGRELIPDIICTTEKGRRDYYEYERGNHTQNDFNDKCAKTFESGAKTMHILTPAKPSAIAIKKQVDKWLSTNAVKKGAGWKIKITTLDLLQKNNIQDDEAWHVIYALDSGTEPVRITPAMLKG